MSTPVEFYLASNDLVAVFFAHDVAVVIIVVIIVVVIRVFKGIKASFEVNLGIGGIDRSAYFDLRPLFKLNRLSTIAILKDADSCVRS